MQSNFEELRERLRWYIYDVPYAEFNEQEVNYIIEQLIKHDMEREKAIKESCIHFSLNDLHNKNNPKKKLLNLIIIGALIVAATVSSFFTIMLH